MCFKNIVRTAKLRSMEYEDDETPSLRDPEMLEAFQSQAHETLESLRTLITQDADIVGEQVSQTYRLLHRFKGDALTLELDMCNRIVERMITPVRRAHDFSLPLSKDMIALLARGLPILEQRIEQPEGPPRREELNYIDS